MRYTSRPDRRTIPKRLLIILGAIVAAALLATAIVRHVYFVNLEPVSKLSRSGQLVTVKRGATADEISKQLEDAGIIKSAWAFKLYISNKNVRDLLQAGTYSFSASQSVPQIVSQLTHGKVATDLVTIIPGLRLDQIRTTLINYGFKEADVDTALNPATYSGNPALVDKPAGASLEGYIYPDSYQKDSNTTPQKIIEEALGQMNKQLTPDLRAAIAQQGLSTYQGIILASVVEREVSNQADRAQAAQVFLKRLRSNIALESNATDFYFNSYHNAGLPPSPISNVTASSLQAVAHPAATDWLYFVSGDDGVTHFSATLDEHQANVQQYCHKLCSQ